MDSINNDPTQQESLMRFSRQQDIVPVLEQKKATIIGTGAIGRQIALMLTSMGIGELQLIDPDIVNEPNVVTQGFLESEIGTPKVLALSNTLQGINNKIILQTLQQRYGIDDSIYEVCFVCVDTMRSREFIYENTLLQNKIKLLIDGRMSGEICRVLTAIQETKEEYKETLFTDEEAAPERCTAKATIYCASLAATLMISQYIKWLREIELKKDIIGNLLLPKVVAN